MRLDVFLAESGLAKSRSYAKELILKGLVTVNGRVVTRPSENCDGDVRVTKEAFDFVGRGGVKLDFALDAFDLDVTGLSAIDVGASTGGFTDCLLKRGAASVTAVDSGHGQLDPSLVKDPRVTDLEGFNAKMLSADAVGVFDIAVMDISFISQTLVLSPVSSVLKDDGVLVSLIKPQFECGRSALSKGGIVKDKKQHLSAVKKVIEAADRAGLVCTKLTESPIKGGDGNREFLALFAKGHGDRIGDETVEGVVLC